MAGDCNRASVVMSDGSKKMQVLQVEVFADDVRDGVEYFEAVGVTHVVQDAPAGGKGAEAIVADLDGNPDHPVAVAVSDRRIRPTDLEKGDTALYSAHEARIDLKADGAHVKGAGGLDSKAGFKTDGHAGLSGQVVITIPPAGGVATLTFKGGLLTAASGAAVFTPDPPA